MKLRIQGKNFKVGDGLKNLSDEKFGRLDKYFHKEQEMDVKFSDLGVDKIVEATIFLKGGTILRAEETTEDFANSIDEAMDSLVRQIRKHKTKLQSKKFNGETIKFDSFETVEDDDEQEESKIVRVKEIPVKPMSKEEAVLQMDLLNHNFFVFTDAETMNVHVVYKRRDGNYGLIVPSQE
ncbi:MAG: ribosome-associated translation inhibitor RaiA [Tissierellia bacterium]|nr:ribosome-associated translation inhibitor RaiA [Tissierellia bacterium]